MWALKVFTAFLVIGSASAATSPEIAALDTEMMNQAGELALAIRNKVRKLGAQFQTPMSKQRRLQEYCWDDCPGAADLPADNHTVCKKPERCEAMPYSDPCISDCSTKMETMIMCETKQYCVDMNKEGACPTTLGLLQGAADNPDAKACAPCAEKTAALQPVMDMAGFNTLDMDVSKMTMGMITEANCPKTKEAGDCALANPECLDPTKSTDGSFMFFTALCECPCGKKLAKFLWDVDSMMFDACSKGVKDGFTTPMPGMAEMGPILFSSGMLECMGCKWNAKACNAAFDKYLLDPGMKALMDGLMSMAGKCDEETTTTTTAPPPTTTVEATPAASSAHGTTYIVGSIVAVFATVQLA